MNADIVTSALNSLARFAFEHHGQNIAGIVQAWRQTDPPELIRVESPQAPPPADKIREQIDSKVDDMIAGRIVKRKASTKR